MKKISFLSIVLLLLATNLINAQSGQIGGATEGHKHDVWVVNSDESDHSGALRLQSKNNGTYRDWLIFNQRNTGELRFGYWQANWHNNDIEDDYTNIPMTLASNGHLTLKSGLKIGNDHDLSGLDLLIGYNDLRFQATPTSGINMYLNTNGYLGIGNENPQERLHVSGNILGSSFFTQKKNNGNSDYSGMKADAGNLIIGSDGEIKFQETDSNETKITFNLNNGAVKIGELGSRDNSLFVGGSSYVNGLLTANDDLMVNGNVDIAYNVIAGGNITAKNVIVGVSSFPDYVFDEDYKLLSLEEVEDYITENKHLPNIPAASEIENGGMDVGKINVLLTEKVEELTLHTIEQNKQIKNLEAELEAIKEMIVSNRTKRNKKSKK